jgi:hypothetical protein
LYYCKTTTIFSRWISPRQGISPLLAILPRNPDIKEWVATPTKITSFYDALTDLFERDNDEYTISFAPGYDADEDDDEVHQRLIDEAVSVAEGRDVVLVNWLCDRIVKKSLVVKNTDPRSGKGVVHLLLAMTSF